MIIEDINTLVNMGYVMPIWGPHLFTTAFLLMYLIDIFQRK